MTARPRSRAFVPAFLVLLLLASEPAMALDLLTLWDFSKPELSEQRFRQALVQAEGDDALILLTQIARTQGLRKDFDGARATLARVEPALGTAGPEARVRYRLELGRTFASATHSPAQLTPETRAQARQAYEAALVIAREARLDGLAVDALHMFAFLDTAPADQLRWGRAALEVIQASAQPDAKRWEASVRNNVGYALHQLGRHEEALGEFQRAVPLREHAGNPGATRVAWWMVAWTLRSLGRIDEALAIQLRLEGEGDAAGEPDPCVFEELVALYTAKGAPERASHYAKRRGAT